MISDARLHELIEYTAFLASANEQACKMMPPPAPSYLIANPTEALDVMVELRNAREKLAGYETAKAAEVPPSE